MKRSKLIKQEMRRGCTNVGAMEVDEEHLVGIEKQSLHKQRDKDVKL